MNAILVLVKANDKKYVESFKKYAVAFLLTAFAFFVELVVKS